MTRWKIDTKSLVSYICILSLALFTRTSLLVSLPRLVPSIKTVFPAECFGFFPPYLVGVVLLFLMVMCDNLYSIS